MTALHELNPDAATSSPIALVIPGIGYTAQAPLLYWASEALIQDGWHVFALAWTINVADRDRLSMFVDDAVGEALGQLPAGPAFVVAKSLGTFALPRFVVAGVPGAWLTPLLTEPSIADALRTASADHLAIGGTSDPAWRPDLLSGTSAELITVDGANHSLELPDADWRDSVALQTELISALAVHAARSR